MDRSETQTGQAQAGAFAPLAGLRVLDLTWFLAGPYATLILADLGAEVIKLEAEAGDASRAIPPHFHRGESAYFMSVNRGKRSVVLDLKQEQGRAVLFDLARRSDVLLESFRPGVTQRLGIDYAALAACNPALVVCSLTGFGLTGPYRERPAYDMIVQALSGGMSLTGEPGGRPVRAGVPIGDLAAGMYAAIGVLAALSERQRTGRGRHLDIAMLDCQVSLLTYQAAYYLLSGEVPGPQGRGHVSFPTYRAFRAGDGLDVLVTANTEAMWRALCQVLQLQELADDPRFRTNAERLAHRAELDRLLEDRFAQRPSDAWLPLLQQAGIPAAPVNTLDRALADPQVAARHMVLDVEHARGGTVRLIGNPIKAEGAPEPATTSPPLLGQQTEDVLRRVLGYDQARLDALRAAGAVRFAEGG